MKKCRKCSGERFLIYLYSPIPCPICNKNEKYLLKTQELCMGCCEPYPCKSDCPCGTYKILLTQN